MLLPVRGMTPVWLTSVPTVAKLGVRACFWSPKYINPPGQKTGVSRRVYTGSTYHYVRLLTSAFRGQSPRDRRPLAMQSRPKLRCSVASWRAPAAAAADSATAPPRYTTSVPEPAVFMILLYVRRCYICTTAQCSVCTWRDVIRPNLTSTDIIIL